MHLYFALLILGLLWCSIVLPTPTRIHRDFWSLQLAVFVGSGTMADLSKQMRQQRKQFEASMEKDEVLGFLASWCGRSKLVILFSSELKGM